jgi:hypothetical protein
MALSALGLASCVAGAGSGADVAAPSAGDCVAIKVWSNGFHTSLALPGEAFGADHPLRQAFPDESYFLVGFGERGYYQKEDPSPADAIRAASFSNPGVLHVIAANEPVEERVWRPTEMRSVVVSREGLAAIAAGVAESIALAPAEEGGEPAPVVVGVGRVAAGERASSLFLEARDRFHLFHMCNHWTAERLAEAGVPIAPGGMFRADPLLKAVEQEALEACPGA